MRFFVLNVLSSLIRSPSHQCGKYGWVPSLVTRILLGLIIISTKPGIAWVLRWAPHCCRRLLPVWQRGLPCSSKGSCLLHTCLFFAVLAAFQLSTKYNRRSDPWRRKRACYHRRYITKYQSKLVISCKSLETNRFNKVLYTSSPWKTSKSKF